MKLHSVADFVNGWGEDRKSLKVLKGEVKVDFQRVFAIYLLKLCLKFNTSEASKKKKLRKSSVLGIKNHRSAAVRPPPHGSASDTYQLNTSIELLLIILVFLYFHLIRQCCVTFVGLYGPEARHPRQPCSLQIL